MSYVQRCLWYKVTDTAGLLSSYSAAGTSHSSVRASLPVLLAKKTAHLPSSRRGDRRRRYRRLDGPRDQRDQVGRVQEPADGRAERDEDVGAGRGETVDAVVFLRLYTSPQCIERIDCDAPSLIVVCSFTATLVSSQVAGPRSLTNRPLDSAHRLSAPVQSTKLARHSRRRTQCSCKSVVETA